MVRPVSRLALSALAAAGMFAAVPALAQSRPDTTRMTCAAASGLVAQRGAAVLSTGPNTFDRYVRSQNFCTPSEVLLPAWVRTADRPSCMIGYTCIESDYDRDIGF